ncbi:MAG: alpha/beta hydrolase [Burkholderiales bacterium]|nr:alpha/beta hydrolase [Burkholderiales bacterium]MDE1928182.1 alpha/beta hydrolase [Burkholderiales bacterium]MDE2503366.1 alpha/beta hydrolase [Burkholderiales bacterium]
MKRGIPALALLALLALGGCAWFSEHQSLWALRPTPGRPAGFEEGGARLRAAFGPADERWTVDVPGARGGSDRLALWWLPQPDPDAPALLYLHGTFRNLYQNLPKIQALREAGFAIVAVDYRGWGDSRAIVPTEASIDADALRAWAELERRQPHPRRRAIYGHSLGGAVAVWLASTLHGGTDYGALVLESTFTTLPDVAAAAGFWGHLAAAVTTLEFDSIDRIARIDAPLLMLHGARDRTVPIALGRRLRDAAPAAAAVRWVEIPGGGHSDLQSVDPARYQRALRALAARLRGAGE